MAMYPRRPGSFHAQASTLAVSTSPRATWRLAFTDPRPTRVANMARWIQYFPAAETVWVLGGARLPRRVDAPPKARQMLL